MLKFYTMKKSIYLLGVFSILAFASCKKEKPEPETPTEAPGPRLIFQYDFDSTQVRLDGFGQPVNVPAGHAAQNPHMNSMTAHYIELAQGAFTPVGQGTIIYHAEETTVGGENAINFSKTKIVAKGETFFSIPLKSITPGDYEYLRVSVGYQNFDIKYYVDTTYVVQGIPDIVIAQDFNGTIASFIGFNSFINNYIIKTETVNVNGNEKQGYWGFETKANYMGYPINYQTTGQSPAGATTVVNPIAGSSPIPAGSCLITGKFPTNKLTITGNETQDIIIRVSMSTNKSFEWVDNNSNGKWDATKGEAVVDMGLRGMIPYIQ